MSCRAECLLLVVVVGLAIGLSAILAWGSLRSYRAEIEREYRTQAELMTATYARVAGRWWVRENIEMMVEAARLMVVGSALFAQVVVDNHPLLDQRDPALTNELLAARDAPSSKPSSLVERTSGGTRYLDVTAPIPVSGLDSPIGHVRIGFDLAFVVRQAHARTWGTAGVVVACDAAVVGAIIGLLVLRSRRRRGSVRDDLEQERGGVLVRGDLRVDPISKTVSVRGQPVDLTPKQFTLLYLLAEVPGRVLPDGDILTAVWPGSAYANSRDVKQCVYTLRRRLGRVVESPSDVVVNVKGYGYKLVPPCDEGSLDST